MKYRFALCLGLLLGAFAGAASAQETQTRPLGGQGGYPVKLDCGEDGAIVGINARVGNFIDNIQPVCRKFRNNQLVGGAYSANDAGGNGGAVVQRLCPTGSVVTALSGSWNARAYNFPGVQIYQNANYVHEIALRCQAWNANTNRFDTVATIAVNGRTPGSERLAATDPAGFCPPNSLGSALAVRAGVYVDSVALICDPARIRVPRWEVVECPARVDTRLNPPGGAGNEWRDARSPPLRLFRAEIERDLMVCTYVALTDRSAQPELWRMTTPLPDNARCVAEPGAPGRVRCSRFGGRDDRPWGRPWDQPR